MHPILLTIKKFKIFTLTIGPLYVYSYGTALVLGFLAATFLGIKRAPSKSIKSDKILDLAFYMLIFGIIGARVSYVAIHAGYYAGHLLEIFNLSKGGLSWHGGLLFAIVTIFMFCKANKINFGDLFDCIAPSFPLGQAIGRIGCFLNGCCGGTAAAGMLGKFIGNFKILNSRHPTQLYELFLDLLIMFFLLFYEKYSRFKGEVFLMYIASYSVVRFFLEYLRDYSDARELAKGAFTLGHYVSLAGFVISVAWIIAGRAKAKKKTG